jgi:hypothetical protein
MNAAQLFINEIATQGSNDVYDALRIAVSEGIVQENQDWENGKSTWTFEDGSAVVMEGESVTVIE